MSIILAHDEEQLAQAEDSKRRLTEERGTAIYTEVKPLDEFTLAEGYHQKYMLTRNKLLTREVRAVYPDMRDFVDSTAAARLNGYLAGYGTKAQLERELPLLGLSSAGRKELLSRANPRGLGFPAPTP